MSNEQKARELLARALNVDEQHVDSSTMIGVTQQWDSLAHMRLILALEEALGNELDMEAVFNIGNLSDVEAMLSEAAPAYNRPGFRVRSRANSRK